MGSIRFRDNVFLNAINKLCSLIELGDLSEALVATELVLHYDVSPDIWRLTHQAAVFTDAICSTSPVDYPVFKTIKVKSFEDGINDIQKAYIYSYCKVIFYITRMYRTGFNVTGTVVGNSYLFGGHYELLKLLQTKYIRYESVKDAVSLIKRIDLYEEEVLGLMADLPIWENLYVPDSNEFFDRKLEFVLASIKHNYNDVWIVNLADQAKITVIPDQMPLGNLAYSSDQSKIKYIDSGFICSDRPSGHWNLANFVTLRAENTLGVDKSIYSTMETANLDIQTIKFEVYSITGLQSVVSLSKSVGSPNSSIGPQPSPSPDSQDDNGGSDKLGSIEIDKKINDIKNNPKPGPGQQKFNKTRDSLGKRLRQKATLLAKEIKKQGMEAIDSGSLLDVVTSFVNQRFNKPKPIDFKNATSAIIEELEKVSVKITEEDKRTVLNTPFASITFGKKDAEINANTNKNSKAENKNK